MPPPKATKLHAKGKPTNIQKTTNVGGDNSGQMDTEESSRQYQLELLWCIQQLERSLNENKANERQAQEAWKALAVLKNNNQPIIRKRQLMRQHFGDYRVKMQAEEKKLVKMAAKMKIQASTDPPKATFVRKSAFLTSGSDFKFNFATPPEELNPCNTEIITTGNTAAVTNTGNTEGNILTGNKDSLDTELNSQKPIRESTNDFKFTFSNSEFKFNFAPDTL